MDSTPQPPEHTSNGQQAAIDYSQPVAYDRQGRPLYARPPENPQAMYFSRPITPAEPAVTDEDMQRHEDSCKKYPDLNLSNGEYIISALKRHPIGLLQIWLVIGVLMLLFAGLFAFLFMNDGLSGLLQSMGGGDTNQLATGSLLLMAVLFVLFVLGGMVATYVYNSNRFYLTNESVIQEIQTTLFAKHEQTVSLGSIEDASYMQNGVFQMMFNYGTIRLSTPGDETTYTFTYVSNPKKHIATLNNAVEAFKNGRPIGDGLHHYF